MLGHVVLHALRVGQNYKQYFIAVKPNHLLVLFNTSFCTMISTAEVRTGASWTRDPPDWGEPCRHCTRCLSRDDTYDVLTAAGEQLRRRATRDRGPHPCVPGPASTSIPRGYRGRLAPLLPARHVPAGPPRAGGRRLWSVAHRWPHSPQRPLSFNLFCDTVSATSVLP